MTACPPNQQLPAKAITGISVQAIVMLLLALTIGLILRLQDLGSVSMDFDECCSWRTSQLPWTEMFDAISRDAHPPLYYIVLKALTEIMGDHDLVLRGFSVVMGLATAVGAGVLAHQMLASESGESLLMDSRRETAMVLAVAFVSLNGLHIEMSQTARPYTLGTLLAVLAAVFLLRSLRSNSRLTDWLGLSICWLCLSITHYYGLLTVASLMGYAIASIGLGLIRSSTRTASRAQGTYLLIAVFVMSEFWLPWHSTFRFQLGRTTHQLWMAPLDWQTFIETSFRALGAGYTEDIAPHWMWIGVAIWILIPLSLLLTRTDRSGLVACAAIGPLLAVVGYGLAVRNILGVKYLIFGQLFLLIALALLIAQIPIRSLRLLTVMTVIAGLSLSANQYLAHRELLAECGGVRRAVTYLEEHRAPDEQVVVGSPFVYTIVVKYAAQPDMICTRNWGDHRDNILSGPALQDDDYRGVEDRLSAGPDRVWTIDAFAMFSPTSRFEGLANMPGWEFESQEEFRERNGIPCVLAVRSYRRSTN